MQKISTIVSEAIEQVEAKRKTFSRRIGYGEAEPARRIP